MDNGLKQQMSDVVAKIAEMCIDPECRNYPHEMVENMHHVPCAMCGYPRPYVEYKDWQTQEEMGKMCGGCLEEAYGDR